MIEQDLGELARGISKKVGAMSGQELMGALFGTQEDHAEDPGIKSDEMGKFLKTAAYDLTRAERLVLGLRFGLNDGIGRTQKEVGQTIGSSRWTVGRIEKRALIKLKIPSGIRGLRAPFDLIRDFGLPDEAEPELFQALLDNITPDKWGELLEIDESVAASRGRPCRL